MLHHAIPSYYISVPSPFFAIHISYFYCSHRVPWAVPQPPSFIFQGISPRWNVWFMELVSILIQRSSSIPRDQSLTDETTLSKGTIAINQLIGDSYHDIPVWGYMLDSNTLRYPLLHSKIMKAKIHWWWFIWISIETDIIFIIFPLLNKSNTLDLHLGVIHSQILHY